MKKGIIEEKIDEYLPVEKGTWGEHIADEIKKAIAKELDEIDKDYIVSAHNLIKIIKKKLGLEDKK